MIYFRCKNYKYLFILSGESKFPKTTKHKLSNLNIYCSLKVNKNDINLIKWGVFVTHCKGPFNRGRSLRQKVNKYKPCNQFQISFTLIFPEWKEGKYGLQKKNYLIFYDETIVEFVTWCNTNELLFLF